MHEHVVHGDRQSGVVPMHDHRHAVAHQQYVNARTINLHMLCMLNLSIMQRLTPGLSILCDPARPCACSTKAL